MATLKDVAKKCKVSVTTVSYALNGSSEVSEETKIKITKVAEEMGYVPNSFARSLKRQKTMRVGIFVTDFAGPIRPVILNGITKAFLETPYHAIVTPTHDEMTLIKDKSVDLAIIMDQTIDENKINELATYSKIIVYDNKNMMNENIYQVLLQNESAIYEETKYLLSQGAKKIAFISGPSISWHNRERYLGYLKAINEENLEEIFYDANSFEENDGYNLMKNTLNGLTELPFDAVVCSNDELAFGLIRALKECGFTVPTDCLVAGFDNVSKSSLISPSLTTIHIDWDLCGKQIAKLAIDVLNDKAVERKVMIPATLVIRESSKRIN